MEVQLSSIADDVRIWVRRGPNGAIQEALQEAANGVQGYALTEGLTCAADKSELLLVFKQRKKMIEKPPDITVHLNRDLIARVDRLSILGLHIRHNGKATHTLELLRQQIAQVTHMIKVRGQVFGKCFQKAISTKDY